MCRLRGNNQCLSKIRRRMGYTDFSRKKKRRIIMKSDTKNCSNLLKRPELKNLGTFTSVYRNGIHKNLIDFCNINYADRERYQKLTESENIVSTFLFNIFAN